MEGGPLSSKALGGDIEIGALMIGSLHRAIRRLPSLFVFGPILGVLVAGVITSGVFTPWNRLGMPPSPPVSFAHISPYRLIVQTESGVLYSRGPYPSTAWTTVTSDNTEALEHAAPSGCGSASIVPPLDGILVEAIVCMPFGPVVTGQRFVILKDGSVWKWTKPLGRGLEGALMGLIVVPPAGIVVSLLSDLVRYLTKYY